MRSILPVILALLVLPAAASAETDLAGEWAARSTHEDQPHRIPGPDLGDYAGLPINDAARLKARSWDASVLTLPERQAQPHPATYSMRGPGPNFRMSKVVDPRTFAVLAYTISGLFGNADRTIWLDGRPRPSEFAEHTWSGFSIGEWQADALKVTTTHLKAGTIQRNGVPTSVHARMTEYFIRHGANLLLVSIVEDPVYLEEPFVRTSNFVWNPQQVLERPSPFEIVDEVAGHVRGDVPSYPMGTVHTEFARMRNLPFEATQGGRASQYPEFARAIRGMNPEMPTRAAPLVAPTLPSRAAPRAGFDTLPVQGNVWMIAGPAGNSALLVTPEGTMVVDSGPTPSAPALIGAIQAVSARPISYVVNTSADPDRVGGNEALSRAGKDPGGNAPGNFGFRVDVAPILAHERVLLRLSAPTGQQAPMPFAAWPTSTYFTEKKTMFVADEPIELLAAPRGYSDGDSIVFFRKSDVVVAGDLLSTDRYPVIDLSRGGSVQGVLDALNRIIDIAIPRFNQQGGTLIVPGHGRICNESDVVEVRDMATIVRDRIQLMVRQGLTLEQVKAARPTLDYDGVYGADSGPWTTEMFVEAVYRDLSARR